MDEELKQEFKRINEGLNKLNTKMDRLKEQQSRNFLESNKGVLASIGFSLVLAGGILLRQQHDWYYSGMFVFLGTFLAVLASFWGTSRFQQFLKYLRIAFWVLLGIAIGLTAYVLVAIYSA